jgi:PKD repeat protein
MLSFHRLKNLWMVWLALLLPTLSTAQFAVSFSGVVSSQGAPVANHPIFYVVYGSNGYPAVSDSTFTNPNGFYSVGPVAISGPQIASAFVYTFDCNGGFLADTIVFTPSNPTVSQVNFTLCANSNPCDASFTLLPGTSPGQMTFVPSFFGQPGLQYQWIFGDGTTSNQTAPTHTFAPGMYTTCLVVTGLGCVDSACINVVVSGGGGSGVCNALFDFQVNGNIVYVGAQDSSANYTYTWDFGDGTVSTGFPYDFHTYAAGGTYNVCLTVVDAANNCADTFCQTVFIGTQTGCHAAFSASIDTAGMVSFASLSQGQGPLTYHWNFDDGTTSSLANPVHTYALPGHYLVCLTITDSTGCTSTHCDLVPVFTTGIGCDAQFIVSVLGGNTLGFLAFNTSGTGVHTWNFGDGNSQSGTFAPSHTYAAPGQYFVCHTVFDSLNQCVDSTCVLVQVGAISNCSASIQAQIDPGNPSMYILTAIPDSAQFAVSYSWHVGGLAGYGPSFTVPVQLIGNSPVCLSVAYANGCVAFVCDSVPVPNLGNSIAGVILFDSTIVVLPTHMEVYLIQHDSLAGTLTAVDTLFVQTPFYQFTNVAPGSYLVKAALLPSAPAYAQYLPTYFGDELFWFDAQTVVMANNSLFLPPINLIPGNNSFGPGFIAGLVVQGANKTDDPMMGVSIILTDAQNNPITGLLTDVNGEFRFQNLPYGTYHVYVEIPGKQGEHWVITLDANTPGHSLVDFVVNSQGIWKADGTTSISDRILAGVNVFPNPFTDYLEVNFEQGAEAEGAVRLVDAQGRTLATRTFERGVSEIRMEMSELPAGMYLLYIQSGDQVKITQVIRR